MNYTNAILSDGRLNYACELMRALAHPLRLKILAYLNENIGCTVLDIHTNLGIEQSVTSQHLKIMKDAGVLSLEREGKNSYYSVNFDILVKAEKAVNKYMLTAVA